MAAMTTALTEFSDNGNSRTYTLNSHTAEKPALVIQTRKVPSGNQVMLEDTINVLVATTDVDSAPLQERVSFKVTCRRPLGGNATDLSNALAWIRDIVAGDEFANTCSTQEWLV